VSAGDAILRGEEFLPTITADLQMLAKYPVYVIILNVIPYTYPVIVGLLVVVALPESIFTRGRTLALPDEPAKRVF
jgi:hypothetical protein